MRPKKYLSAHRRVRIISEINMIIFFISTLWINNFFDNITKDIIVINNILSSFDDIKNFPQKLIVFVFWYARNKAIKQNVESWIELLPSIQLFHQVGAVFQHSGD